MTYPFEQEIVWHVCFHPEKKWWSGKYSHVSLAGYSNDTWLHLDLHSGGVSMALLFAHDDVEGFLSYLLAHYTVLRLPPLPPRSRFLRPMSCVAFVKHVTGVRSGALRPDRLFRDLRAMIGVELLNETEDPQGNPGTGATAYSR